MPEVFSVGWPQEIILGEETHSTDPCLAGPEDTYNTSLKTAYCLYTLKS